jgi:hypothetical protein
MKTLNRIASNVQDKLDKRRRHRLLPVLDVVRSAVLKGRAVLYGGMAMNLYLPKKARFYDPDIHVPDYDVFVTNAKSFTVRLADRMKRLGYEHVEVRCALHPGTYKLSWDSESLLDVTEVSSSEMKRLRKNSTRTPEGFLLCPLSYLKAHAYLELASPDTASFRWTKVYKRVQLLEAHLRAPRHCSIPTRPTDAIPHSHNDPRFSLTTGIDAAYHYLGYTPLQTENPQMLGPIQYFPYPFFKKTLVYPHLFQVEIKQGRSWIPYARVHDVSSQCVSFDPDAPQFASIFHVLYVGYMEHYVYGKTNIPLRDLLRKTNESHFHSECMGTAMTLQNLKRARSAWTYSPR